MQCLVSITHKDTKAKYINDFISADCKYYAIALTETHLEPGILDSEIYVNNYTVFRQDRASRKSGGVAIYIRSDLSCEVFCSFSNSV